MIIKAIGEFAAFESNAYSRNKQKHIHTANSFFLNISNGEKVNQNTNKHGYTEQKRLQETHPPSTYRETGVSCYSNLTETFRLQKRSAPDENLQ